MSNTREVKDECATQNWYYGRLELNRLSAASIFHTRGFLFPVERLDFSVIFAVIKDGRQGERVCVKCEVNVRIRADTKKARFARRSRVEAAWRALKHEKKKDKQKSCK